MRKALAQPHTKQFLKFAVVGLISFGIDWGMLIALVELFQSNHEGAIVDAIQAAYGTADGIVINPAAYTHTSVAILDALKAVALPAVEVHLSDVSTREPFRQISYAGMACVKTYMGLGFEGYRQAILYLKQYLEEANA